MLKKSPFILCFLLVYSYVQAQIPLGEWRDHLPYISGCHSVAVCGSRVYCANDHALFYYDKSDGSLNTFSKVDGLSDVGVAVIDKHQASDQLIVVYTNGNIDLVEPDGRVHNLPDLKNKLLYGTKTVYSITFRNQYAYLACSFGVLVLNLEKQEVADTYYIGEGGSSLKVYDMTYDSTYLYAATDFGIYYAERDLSDLSNFNRWSRVEGIPHDNETYDHICYFQDYLLASYLQDDDTSLLYVFSDDFSKWEVLDSSYVKVRSLRSFKDSLSLVSLVSYPRVYNFDKQLVLTDSISYGPFSATDVSIDHDGSYWIADKQLGLVRSPEVTSFAPNGPFFNNVFNIEAVGNHIWMASGGFAADGNNTNFPALGYHFYDGYWTSFGDPASRDWVAARPNPNNSDECFFASWGDGIAKVDRNKGIVEKWDQYNSLLDSEIEGAPYCRIGQMDFDSYGNMWIINSVKYHERLAVYTRTGEWIDYDFGDQQDETIYDLVLTKYGHKWIVIRRGNQKLAVFSDAGTLEDKSDDQVRKFNPVDAEGTSFSKIGAIAEDRNGAIWIGTNQGVLVYYSPEYIFDDFDMRGQRVITEISGEPQYLLEADLVTAIAIDGANRKWFGTENSGVFLMSEDATEEILHFNQENSPLLSNTINDIAITQDGEVFFGTSKGLISYREQATFGQDDYSDVYAFPNPVTPDYDGDITITGLVTDVNIKITDLAGHLVYEDKALGGQAVWNGQSFSGDRVQTGVYLVFCSNDDGSKTLVTKILFIN